MTLFSASALEACAAAQRARSLGGIKGTDPNALKLIGADVHRGMGSPATRSAAVQSVLQARSGTRPSKRTRVGGPSKA